MGVIRGRPWDSGASQVPTDKGGRVKYTFIATCLAFICSTAVWLVTGTLPIQYFLGLAIPVIAIGVICDLVEKWSKK
jgi:hypothetical protein